MSAAFRLFTPFQTFFDLKGQPCALGSLVFYQSGTTTPADVYGDEALTVNNGSTIDLGTDGRPVDDIWGNINYRARLYDVSGTLVDDLPDIQIPGGTGLTIPTLESGSFLTNDGSVLAWETIGQVPDPTGSSGKVLSNDGTNFIWIEKPSNGTTPTVPITVTASSGKFGDTTYGHSLLIQTGTSTCPASGGVGATQSITFPVAFDSAPMHFGLTVNSGSQPGGLIVWCLTAPATASGCSILFDVAEGSGANPNVINPITYTWVAYGRVTP